VAEESRREEVDERLPEWMRMLKKKVEKVLAERDVGD